MRFSEFTEEWESTTIKNVCSEFQSGKNIKAEMITCQGLYPVYGGNGLRGFTGSYNHEGDYVLIGRQGALCGNIRKVTGRTYITEHAIAVCASEKNDTAFLQYLFQRMKLGQYSDQSAQPGLAVNKLLRLNIKVPSKIEQVKIAKVLSLLDERISTQNKIIEKLETLIKGIVELAFSHAATSNTLGCHITQISQRNKNGKDLPVLSVSNKYGFVEQSEQFEDRIIASDDTSNYKIVSINDFAFNPARINVGSIARLKDKECGIVSPMYICFRTSKDILPEYLELFFKTVTFSSEVGKRLEGSVRLCLSFESLCEIVIPVISIREQQSLVKMATAFYSKLDVEKGILRSYQSQKQYLLSQMFI